MIRVLKIPGKIACLVPNYTGRLQIPTEGSYLMVKDPGKEPVPYVWTPLDRARHTLEQFDNTKDGNVKSFLSPMFTHSGVDSSLQVSSAPTISTLDRKRLQRSDCIELIRQAPAMKTPNGASVQLPHQFKYPISFAFLYYHLPPGLPATAGAIRMRITSSPDPSTFESGADLVQRQGLWSLPLLTLATTKYTGLIDLLLDEGLVAPDTLLLCKAICAQQPPLSTVQFTRTVLHSFVEPFFLNLPHLSLGVYTIHHKKKANRFYLLMPLSGVFSQGIIPIFTGNCHW